MADSSLVPAIVGLVIGAAFVIMFSQVFVPATTLTDEKIVEKTKSLQEVQFFLEMHPDAEIRVERDDAPREVDVYYSVDKRVHEPRAFDSGVKTKELVVRVNSLDTTSLMFICGGGGRSAIAFHVTMDVIANMCFQ